MLEPQFVEVHGWGGRLVPGAALALLLGTATAMVVEVRGETFPQWQEEDAAECDDLVEDEMLLRHGVPTLTAQPPV